MKKHFVTLLVAVLSVCAAPAAKPMPKLTFDSTSRTAPAATVPASDQAVRSVKRFDEDAVGADLRVRPDAEVDVSGQAPRSAPTVSSLVTK